jgi:hypothetical protein
MAAIAVAALNSTSLLVVIQGAVAWQRRAVATGLVQFSRTIGGAVGVGLMGGALTAVVGTASSEILDPIARSTLPTATLVADRGALADGLGLIYRSLLVAAVGALLLAVRSMPDVSLGHEIGSSAATAIREAGSPASARTPSR